MNRGKWINGHKAHRPTIEEELAMDEAWCHAATKK